MPVQNGIATLARMHDDPALKDIPVIIMAARELSATEMQQLESCTRDIMASTGAQQRPLTSVLLEAVRPVHGSDASESALFHQD